MALRGKTPVIEPDPRCKMILYGNEKVGKTTFAIGFPGLYYIDTEGGAVREQYREQLIKSGAAYMGPKEGSQDIEEVVKEIKELSTTKHNYKTLVIDSFTKLYNVKKVIEEDKQKSINTFGVEIKAANKPARQLLRWILMCDMNVILVCYSLKIWKDGQVVGNTFDINEKLNFGYDMDLIVEANKVGKERTYMVKGGRVKAMPEGTMGSLNYKDFASVFGKGTIEAEVKPIQLAGKDKVDELTSLLTEYVVPDEWITKWKEQIGEPEFNCFTQEQIQACIDFVNKKIKEGKLQKESQL